MDGYIRLLGPVGVTCDGHPVDIGGPTARAVLATLALHGGAGARTGELIVAVWGGPGAASRDSVYHYVAALRAALAGAGLAGALTNRGSRYLLVVEDQQVDWRRFQQLVAAARHARDDRDLDRAACVLEQAIDLWAGDPLADIGDRLSGPRTDLILRRLAALEELASVEAARRRPERVVDLLSEEATRHPGRERMAALLVRALDAQGRRDEAGAVFRRTRGHLIEQFGLDPGDELATAHQQLLQAPAVPPQRQSPAEVSSAPGTGSVQATRGADRADPPGGHGRRARPISGMPRPDRHFTGRADDVRQLIDSLTPAGGDPVCAVWGMAGVGKTALAVHVADRLAARYSGGRLFIDLHGHAGHRAPLTAAEATDRLLRRLGVDGSRIPADPEERAALYRELLADRQMLIILDNAHDAGQVRQLLPAAPGCGVVVTSRHRLAALDDVPTIPLEVLSHAEAVQLFQTVVGAERLAGQPQLTPVVHEIVDACGRLPLAVRIAAARYRVRDVHGLPELAIRLRQAHSALAELDDGDRSVAASFQLSVDDLPLATAAVFALLAQHPGADFDVWAAAAVAGQPVAAADRAIDALVQRHLLSTPTPGRYRMHDLIRFFAQGYASRAVPESQRAAALRRLVDYHLCAADRADSTITPHRYRVALAVANPRQPTPDRLDDYDAALAWLTTEQFNLVDVCLAAHAAGMDACCWQLAYTLRGHYFLAKLWTPWLRTHRVALASAERCGDVRAQAMILNQLGVATFEQGHLDAAGELHDRALRLFRQVGDVHGEHNTLANRAWIRFARRQFADFLRDIAPVLRHYRAQHSPWNIAITLRGVGLAEAELGRHSDATAHLSEALAMFEGQHNLWLDIAMTLNGLGESHQRAGDHDRAAEAFTRAIAASLRGGSAFEHARAHHRLGQLAADGGRLRAAREHWTTALATYQSLGAPQRLELRERLDALPA